MEQIGSAASAAGKMRMNEDQILFVNKGNRRHH
jgi:hypothetical protein